MTVLEVAPPSRGGTVHDGPPSVDAARADRPGVHPLDQWACGVATDARHGVGNRCQDVLPELILELL